MRPIANSTTPFKKKSLLRTTYSTTSAEHDPVILSLGSQMVPHVVGPMPVQDFLSTYLPQKGNTRVPKSRAKRFNLPSRQKMEDDAYFPFITAISSLVPGLGFVDTHARGDKKSGFSFEIKPDITVYADRRDPTNGCCDTRTMEMHIEFKWGGDPFLIPKEGTLRKEQSFVKDSNAAREILGQITAYASAQMSAQFRTHVFSVFVTPTAARILRWDREGVVVTEPIPYADDPALVEFFSRYSHSSNEERGVDTTISPVTGVEAELAINKLGLPEGTPMFKSKILKAATAAEQHSPSKSMITLIFPAPESLPELPACRGTRGCPAYLVEEDRTVYLKDSWPIVTQGIDPEGEIYAKLNEAQVPYVPVCLASGSVECHDFQLPQTWKCSQKDWACCLGLRIPAHSHYRLVLDIVGKPLSEFASTKELVQAIRDALQAHQAACVIKILHRDISAGNIIIFQGRGYLIDWEMAKHLGLSSPRRSSRTGTWQFMSARLVENRLAEQGASDDIESAFWVLLWITLMYSPSSLSQEQRINFIQNTFEINEGSQAKRSVFMSQEIFNHPLFPGRESLNKLFNNLAELFKYYYDRVESTDDEVILSLDAVNSIVRHTHPAFKRAAARKHLETHDYVIKLFDEHLELAWPSNDKSQEQHFPLTSVRGVRLMTMRKSKHTLEPIDEQDRKRRKLGPYKAKSDNILGRRLSLEESDVEE